MRIQCPQCQTALQLPQAPPPGAKIQCGKCGARISIKTPSAVTPVVLPGTVTRPRPIAPASIVPVAVTEVPVTVDEGFDDAAPAPLKKRKKKKFRRSSRSSSNPAVKFVLAFVIFGVLAGVGTFIAVKSGVFGRLSVVEFNNEMLKIFTELGKSGQQFQQGAPGFMNNPAQAMEKLGEAKSIVAKALKNVKSLSPPSDGQRFHDATVLFLDRMDRFLGADVKQLMSLMQNGRQNEGMQIILAAVSELQQLATGMVNAQHEMANKHNLIKMEAPKGGAFP